MPATPVIRPPPPTRRGRAVLRLANALEQQPTGPQPQHPAQGGYNGPAGYGAQGGYDAHGYESGGMPAPHAPSYQPADYGYTQTYADAGQEGGWDYAEQGPYPAAPQYGVPAYPGPARQPEPPVQGGPGAYPAAPAEGPYPGAPAEPGHDPAYGMPGEYAGARDYAAPGDYGSAAYGNPVAGQAGTAAFCAGEHSRPAPATADRSARQGDRGQPDIGIPAADEEATASAWLAPCRLPCHRRPDPAR